MPSSEQTVQLERYQQVLEIMPAGVILLDPHGLIAEANIEAHRLLGVPLLKERWLTIIERAFSPKDDDGHEVSLRNGLRVKLAISASKAGQVILITDMTETRLLQARVSDLQRLSSLGKMVASLAHQVRTPLSSAMLYAANLNAPQLDPQKRVQFQNKLIDRLKDLEQQVEDMLLFAKGGNNKVIAPFAISELLDHFEPMVEHLILTHKVHFSIDCPDEQIQISGNMNALAQAMSNLVINAIQHAGTACIINIKINKNKNIIYIAVSDNGPGIEKELQQKILEPFFTTRQQGTGLGLSVVQMVCQAHNGHLTIHSEKTWGDSEKKYGACFIMEIPIFTANNH